MLRELVIISLFLTSLLLYFNPQAYNNPPSFLPYNQLFNGTPMSDLLNKLGQSLRAPIGITDYGISPNGPFIRNTTQFLGIVTIYNLTANSTAPFAPNSVSFQLNTVLSYISNGRHYAIWTQNVIIYNTLTHNVVFVDNLWNFTSLYANITSVKGNGNTSVAKIHGYYIRFYYDYANTTGSNTTVTLPIKIMLLTNVTINSEGEPVICFWYNDGFGWQKYDEVTITNSPNSSDAYFLVDGFNFTGSRTYYDAELIVGGPGDGSCAYILNSYVTLQLEYWNGHNFQEVRNAFNFGSDTGETAWGVSTKFYYYTFSGQPAVLLISGQQVLSQLWDENQVSTLSIRTDVTSGNITVYLLSNHSLEYGSYKQSIPFVGGEVVLTLVKGFYGVLVYNSSDDLVGEANVKVNNTNVYAVTIPFNVSSENEVTTSNYLVADEVQFKITADGYVNVSFGGNVRDRKS
ncbi:MAG: thermopsin, partial [Sulfolobaceae archaeon]